MSDNIGMHWEFGRNDRRYIFMLLFQELKFYVENIFLFLKKLVSFLCASINPMKDKSRLTGEEAQFLVDQKKWNSAASRLYYSVFQSVLGYARRKGRVDPEEKDKLHGIALSIIRRSEFPYVKSKTGSYKTLLGLRVIADYKPENIEDTDITQEIITDAKGLRDFYSTRV